MLDQRLPLGALIRDEKTNCIYFVIKVVKVKEEVVYFLCLIFDPSATETKPLFSFHFTLGSEKAENYNVLNTRIKVNSDGTVSHSLTFMDGREADSLKGVDDFALRYFTACRFYNHRRKLFEIVSVDKQNKTLNVSRKSSFIEKLFFGPNFLVFTIAWEELIREYIPHIPKNISEELYLKSIEERCYF